MKKRINISISEFVLSELDDLAKEYGFDRSAMIAYLVLKEQGLRVDDEALEGVL